MSERRRVRRTPMRLILPVQDIRRASLLYQFAIGQERCQALRHKIIFRRRATFRLRLGLPCGNELVMSRIAHARFDALRIGNLLCDGAFEVRFCRNFHFVEWAEVEHAFDDEGDEITHFVVPAAAVVAALETQRKRDILDAISDAEAYA